MFKIFTVLLLSLFSLGFINADGHTAEEKEKAMHTMSATNMTSGLAHLILYVDQPHHEKMVKFYNVTSKVLEMKVLKEEKKGKMVVATMYGMEMPSIIIALAGDSMGGNAVRMPTTPTHFAFYAATRKHVDAWYAAALKNGGKDNGKPGIRANYAPNYYAAFVIDPAGNNVEVITFAAK